MDNIKERLTAKLGPLPVWAWGLIAAVLAFIAYLYYQRSGSANSSTEIDPDSIPSIDGSGYQTAGIKGGTGTLTSDEPDTNQKWLNRASKAVADSIGVSASEVYNALSKWLQGQNYTEREKTFIDRAINLAMLPPEGTFGNGEVIRDPSDAIGNPNPTPVKPIPPKSPRPVPPAKPLPGYRMPVQPRAPKPAPTPPRKPVTQPAPSKGYRPTDEPKTRTPKTGKAAPPATKQRAVSRSTKTQRIVA
jgi:hypothetical protein